MKTMFILKEWNNLEKKLKDLMNKAKKIKKKNKILKMTFYNKNKLTLF
jgi:hypothetical protein